MNREVVCRNCDVKKESNAKWDEERTPFSSRAARSQNRDGDSNVHMLHVRVSRMARFPWHKVAIKYGDSTTFAHVKIYNFLIDF